MTGQSKALRESRTDGTVKALTEWIIEHGLRSGDPLPSESELCEELGIGRNSLREAVRTLRATGVLEVRHGSGTFVGILSMQALSDELLFHSRLNSADSPSYLRDLSEVREALEQGFITNLITEGLMPDVPRLSALLDQMDAEAQSGHIDAETDRQFHEALLAPLENPVAIMLLQVFWRVFDELLTPLDEPALAAKSADRHHAILLAVKAADARGARVAVRAHFEHLRHRLGMEETDPQAD